MKYRSFGKLDWKISEISLGTYAIGGNWGSQDDKDSLKTISRALELGVNFIDTADVYGLGKAETLIGSAIKQNRQKVLVATKGGRDFTTTPPKIFKNFEIPYLSKALDGSLNRLGIDYVDLYQLHGPSIEIMQKGEVFEFLKKAKDSGKIHAAGVSVDNYDEVKLAVQSGQIDSVQFPFNFVEQGEGIAAMRYCFNNNVAVIIREPLAQGLLSNKYSLNATFPNDDHRSRKWSTEYLNDRLNKMEPAKKCLLPERSMVHLALQYILIFPQVSTVIPGARNIEQIEHNVQALATKSLTIEEFQCLFELKS